MKDKAVVLMYYGFPEKREGMQDYLRGILHGREPPESLIRENLFKLDVVGGETPSTRIVNSIRDKLEVKLEGEGYKVYLLSKHYIPAITDAPDLVSEEQVFEIPLFPVYSRFIFDGYFEPLESSLKNRKFVRIENIGFDKGIIEFYQRKIRAEKGSIITFSAHSIPL